MLLDLSPEEIRTLQNAHIDSAMEHGMSVTEHHHHLAGDEKAGAPAEHIEDIKQ